MTEINKHEFNYVDLLDEKCEAVLFWRKRNNQVLDAKNFAQKFFTLSAIFSRDQ